MNFPLSHQQCEALQKTIQGKRDAAGKAENFTAWDAYHDALNLIHEARMAAADTRLDKRRKTLGLRLTR